MRRQIFVGARKMMIAEKSAMCRQWRRVRRCQHQMPRTVDESPFLDGIRPPKKEHEVFAFTRQMCDNGIGKCFPTAALMRSGHMGTHRKRCVQQQHALTRPARQVAALRYFSTYVTLDFLENIEQRRRKSHSVVHRKAQSVRLIDVMIRVLSQITTFTSLNGVASNAANICRPGGNICAVRYSSCTNFVRFENSPFQTPRQAPLSSSVQSLHP